MLAILIFFAGCAAFLLAAAAVVDSGARWVPDYGKIDLAASTATPRGEWTDEDYKALTMQTGILSREALDELPVEWLELYQNAFFFEGTVRHDAIIPGFSFQDLLFDPATDEVFYATVVHLYPGDVVVTSSTHTLGYRHGHSALILSNDRMLQSISAGAKSRASYLNEIEEGLFWYLRCTNFMVLRLKDASAETRKEIADLADEQLQGIPYSLTVGIFSKKNQGASPGQTHCAHLVWQAFKNCGYDVDADGGPVVTPRDIARSEHFEVVQVYGFDPEKLW